MDLKPGDKVLYAKYAGTEFKLDGEDLLIISQQGHPRGRRGLTVGQASTPALPATAGAPRAHS